MRALAVLVGTALVCSAAGGGVSYAYATSVVPGLDRVDPKVAVTAMRGIISEAASNPFFLLLLIGAAVLAVIVGTFAAATIRKPGSAYLLIGSLCTLAAGIVTVAFNVPLNKELNHVGSVDLSALDANSKWRHYVEPWVLWNDIRCAAALVGAAFFAAGLLALVRRSEPAETHK